MATGYIRIDGIEELKLTLNSIAPKHARNLMRATIHGVASDIAKRVKQNAPTGASGLLKKNVKAKRKKSPPDKPFSEVHIEKAYYWRFVEYGTGGGKGSHINKNYMGNAKPFIRPVIDAMRPDMDRIMQEQFGKKLEKMLAREAKKKAKL